MQILTCPKNNWVDYAYHHGCRGYHKMKITIDQCREICKQKPEFTERDKGDYIVFDYVINDSHSFDNPIALEMRGIAFDLDGGIVSRPLHKFFNYGEKPVEIDTASAVVTSKLDGSMIRTIKTKNGFVLGTRAGETDVSALATTFIDDHFDHYELCEWAVEQGLTAIFEFCSHENRVVIDYGSEPKMTLLALRYNNTGVYVKRDALVAVADTFGVPVVQQWRLKSLSELVDEIKPLKGEEGIVIASDSGWVKIKADEYCMMHKACDQIKFDKDAVRLIMSGLIDDVLPLLSGSRLNEIENLRTMVNSGFVAMQHALTTECNRILDEVGGNRKEFAERIKDHKYKSILFALAYGGGTPVYDYIMKSTNRIQSWDDCYEELQSFL